MPKRRPVTRPDRGSERNASEDRDEGLGVHVDDWFSRDNDRCIHTDETHLCVAGVRLRSGDSVVKVRSKSSSTVEKSWRKSEFGGSPFFVS